MHQLWSILRLPPTTKDNRHIITTSIDESWRFAHISCNGHKSWTLSTKTRRISINIANTSSLIILPFDLANQFSSYQPTIDDSIDHSPLNNKLQSRCTKAGPHSTKDMHHLHTKNLRRSLSNKLNVNEVDVLVDCCQLSSLWANDDDAEKPSANNTAVTTFAGCTTTPKATWDAIFVLAFGSSHNVAFTGNRKVPFSKRFMCIHGAYCVSVYMSSQLYLAHIAHIQKMVWKISEIFSTATALRPCQVLNTATAQTLYYYFEAS